MKMTLEDQARWWRTRCDLTHAQAVAEAAKSGCRATGEERARVIALLTEEDNAANARIAAACKARLAALAEADKAKAEAKAKADSAKAAEQARRDELAALLAAIVRRAKEVGRSDLWEVTYARRADDPATHWDDGGSSMTTTGRDEAAGAAWDAREDADKLRAILAEIGGAL